MYSVPSGIGVREYGFGSSAAGGSAAGMLVSPPLPLHAHRTKARESITSASLFIKSSFITVRMPHYTSIKHKCQE